VRGVDPGGDDHVPQRDPVAQPAGDADEEDRGRAELGDGAFGDGRGGRVAHADRRQGDAAPRPPGEPAHVEHGARRLVVRTHVGQVLPHGRVLQVERGQDHDHRLSLLCPRSQTPERVLVKMTIIAVTAGRNDVVTCCRQNDVN